MAMHDPHLSVDPRLEHELGLKQLVDVESLHNLCRSFADMCGSGMLVVNFDGEELYRDSRSVRRCSPGCDACFPGRISGQEPKLGTVACSSGDVYVRAQIHNQFDPVGAIMLGPFPTSARADQAMPQLRFLSTVLEELVLVNYRSYLTSKINLQTHSQSALIDKDRELQAYEQTLAQSQALHSFF